VVVVALLKVLDQSGCRLHKRINFTENVEMVTGLADAVQYR